MCHDAFTLSRVPQPEEYGMTPLLIDMTTCIRIIAGILCAISVYGCTQKELVFPGEEMATVSVRFMWDHAEEASVDGMTLYFFSADGISKNWRFDIAGREGGKIEIPIGRYHLVACNNDLPGIEIENADQYCSISATARRWITTGTFTSTGMLYGSTVDDIYVTPCGVAYETPSGETKECDHSLVRCFPDSLSTQYTVNITNVSGLEHVRSVSALLSGEASALTLADHLPSGFGQELSFGLLADRTDNRLYGSGCAFNYEDGRMEPYILSIIVMLDTGKSLKKTITLTPENINILSRHNVIINVNDFEIPDESDSPPEDVGDINVSVDGWNVIVIDIYNTYNNWKG